MQRFATRLTRAGTIICALVVGPLFLTTAATAQPRAGQQQRGNQAQQQQRQIRFVTVDGKVTNLQRGAIAFDSDGKSYIVQLHPQKTRLLVVGEATVDVLQPGVLVQFEALLNPQLTLAKKPIEKLSVLTPSARTAPGVISDTPKDRTKPFTVRGKISRVVGPKLQIAASRKKVRIVLAKEATVVVEVSDLSLVARGDKIEVKGAEVNPGLLHATDVKITLSKPLGEAESDEDGRDKDTAKKAKPRRSTKKKKS
jgi:hypothetical protein